MLEDRFMDFIEVKGKTVNEALTNAAVELKTTSDKLEYEVIDKGSSGFLGFIGSKPVVIRVRKKAETPVSSDVQEDVSLEERSEAPAEKKITEEQAPSSDAPAESFTEKILAEEEPVNDEAEQQSQEVPSSEEPSAQETSTPDYDIQLELTRSNLSTLSMSWIILLSKVSSTNGRQMSR